MSRRRLVLITAALAAIFVAGCDSGYHYVKSSEDKTYFKVPKEWKLYDEKEFIDYAGADLSRSEREEVLDSGWRVAFDGAPHPKLAHVLQVQTNHPTGQAYVRSLSFDAADTMSNQTLRNLAFDVDTALQNETGEVLDYEELSLKGGFRGIHLVASLQANNGKNVVLDQTALVDQETSKLYVLFLSCSSKCYDDNRGKIQRIVESWTVRD